MAAGLRFCFTVLASHLWLCQCGGSSEPTSLRGSASHAVPEPSGAANETTAATEAAAAPAPSTGAVSPATVAAPPTSPPAASRPPMASSCSCNFADTSCECSTSGGVNNGEGTIGGQLQGEIAESLKNQTKALMAWWTEQTETVRGMHCSCVVGSTSCLCNDTSNTTGKVAASKMKLSETQSLDSVLKNQTESVLSMWWAGGCHIGPFYHPFYHPYYHPYFYHPYYHPYGVAGGCGCHYYGCHCGHVVY